METSKVWVVACVLDDYIADVLDVFWDLKDAFGACFDSAYVDMQSPVFNADELTVARTKFINQQWDAANPYGVIVPNGDFGYSVHIFQYSYSIVPKQVL